MLKDAYSGVENGDQKRWSQKSLLIDIYNSSTTDKTMQSGHSNKHII